MKCITRIVITLLICSLFTGCSQQTVFLSPSPPNSTRNLTTYPGAIGTVLDDKSTNPNLPWRVLTFTTADQPDQVLDFYEDVLRKEGWHQEHSSTDSRIF